MNPALRASAAHVFVDSLDAITLTTDDAHHLLRVLRLREGESVTVSDGRGSWRSCKVAGDALVPVAGVICEPAPAQLTIAAAIPKGDRLEWMVQKLTELGASEIVLLHFERSVVRWKGERGTQQLARLTRVVREAAMQSRRVWLPTVRGPVDFAEAAKLPGAAIADPEGGDGVGVTTVLIGPEGGLTEGERSLCAASVNLGRHILRVETAAVAAAAILGRDPTRLET